MADAYRDLVMGHMFSDTQQWVRPAYQGQSIINVMNSILRYFGVDYGSPLYFHEAFTQRLGGKQKILFFFIDGLGWHNLEYAIQCDPRIADVLATTTRWPLTSVSPSTTSSATASYLTALPPVEHGVLGFLMYFPEYNHVFNMLSFRSPDRLHEDLIVRGFLPEKYLTQPTVLAMLEDSGILVGAYNNTQYAGSGLSRLIYTDHLPYHYFALGDMLWLAQQQLELPARQFQFLYWSTPDTIAHTYGARSGAYVHEVFMLLSMVKQLLIPQLDDDTAMIICADHGHIDGNDDEAIDLTKIPGLVDLFRVPPAGEGRATQLFIRPGYVDEAKAQLLAAGNMLVMTRDEYIASKLLGDATPRQDILEKLGDLVVLPHGSRRTLYPYEMRPHTAMVGRHGGLSPEEMVIPLIVF